MGTQVALTSEQVDTLERQIVELSLRIDIAKHAMLTHLREFDACEGWGGTGFLSTSHWLAWRIGISPAAAREHVRVARALGELQRVDAAFAEGKLSYSKVRALTRVATPETEECLLDIAMHATGRRGRVLARRHASAAEHGPHARLRLYARGRRSRGIGGDPRCRASASDDSIGDWPRPVAAGWRLPSARLRAQAASTRAPHRGLGGGRKDGAVEPGAPVSESPRARARWEAVDWRSGREAGVSQCHGIEAETRARPRAELEAVDRWLRTAETRDEGDRYPRWDGSPLDLDMVLSWIYRETGASLQ